MIRGIEGGMRMPSAPPGAGEPKTSGRAWPRRSISGMEISPIVAAVATLEPEIAAKIAHEKMLATASPPGRNDTQRATAGEGPLPRPECRGRPRMDTKGGTVVDEEVHAVDA